MATMYVKPLADGNFLCTIGDKEYTYTSAQVRSSWYTKVLVTNVGPAPIKSFSL